MEKGREREREKRLDYFSLGGCIELVSGSQGLLSPLQKTGPKVLSELKHTHTNTHLSSHSPEARFTQITCQAKTKLQRTQSITPPELSALRPNRDYGSL